MAGLLLLTGLARAGLLTFPDSIDKTSGYNEVHTLDMPIREDPAVYLVCTMTFSNPSGTLASGTLWNQTATYSGNAERTSVGQPARSDKWGILGFANFPSDTTIALDTPTLLVMKIDQVTGKAWLWLNPDLTQPEPAPETADVEVMDARISDEITALRFRGGQYGGGSNTNLVDSIGAALYFGGDTPFNVPSPRFELRIAANPSTPGYYDFEWDSQGGKVYDLVSATDLSTAPETWAVWDGRADLPATPPTNSLAAIAGGGDTRRFFAVVEKEAPPIFSADFETDDAGFSVNTTAGSDWQRGTPDTSGFGGSLTGGNDGSANCWGTVLGDFTDSGAGFEGYYANPTTTTLRSPVIDLTGVAGAELGFAEALDLQGADSAEVHVIDNATHTAIGPALYTATDGNTSALTWATVGPIALPAEALGKQVYFEWRFNGQADQFAGWYIDDVTVFPAAAP